MQRTSKNRLVGTVELTTVSNCREESGLSRHVAGQRHPAIGGKFPCRSQREAFYLQQDNARPQVKEDDPLVSEAGRQLRRDLRVMC